MSIIKSENIISNPEISIVVCAYNRKNYIGQCLDSILAQKRDFPIEIIVGDDGSTDGTRDLLLEYQQKYSDIFVLLFQEKNLGLGGNWASTVKLARGKYIAYCDDDDYWHNEYKLCKQKEVLDNHLEIGLVHTDYRTIDEQGQITEKQIKNIEDDDLIQLFFRGKYVCIICTVLFRKQLLDKYVNLDDYITFMFPIQDWSTYILLAKHTTFYHLSESTFTCRIFEGTMSRPTSYEKLSVKYAKEKIMYKYLCDKFPDDLPFDEKGWDIYVNNLLLSLAYKKHDFKSAKKFSEVYFNLTNGGKSLRAKCAESRILFFLFILAKKFSKCFQ